MWPKDRIPPMPEEELTASFSHYDSAKRSLLGRWHVIKLTNIAANFAESFFSALLRAACKAVWQCDVCSCKHSSWPVQSSLLSGAQMLRPSIFDMTVQQIQLDPSKLNHLSSQVRQANRAHFAGSLGQTKMASDGPEWLRATVRTALHIR